MTMARGAVAVLLWAMLPTAGCLIWGLNARLCKESFFQALMSGKAFRF